MDEPNITLINSDSEALEVKSINENKVLLKAEIEENPLLNGPRTLQKILSIIDNVSTGKYTNT